MQLLINTFYYSCIIMLHECNYLIDYRYKNVIKTENPSVFGSAVNGPIRLSQAIWKYPNMVDPLKISLVEKFITAIS